ncbi:MAG: c-type cytochrome [Methylobacillus sp.]|jgi:cytochrome c-L|nr:c-type cytochrome [Methylobacillus sp.]
MKSKTVGKIALFALVAAGLMPLTASAECKFVTTKAGNAPFVIKPTDKDSAEAKKFLETCINPYTKMYAADPEAAKAGKKLFGYWSCTQCHGGNAGGQTGPSIIDDTWQYAKHQTDKGMFETIADGSDAGMPAWHAQAANNPELLSTDDILKIIGWLRASYKGTDQSKPWMKE